MDNYFTMFGICVNSTNISQYGNNKNVIRLNQGDLIKVSSQPIPNNREIRPILLYSASHIAMGDNVDRTDPIFLCSENNFEIVEENFWPYLIIETNPLLRFKVFNNRENLLSLKIGEMIKIYISVQNTEKELCCRIEYIGEVLEYGNGVYFCLRLMENFEFSKNPQTDFIAKYATGNPAKLVIVTASVFLDQFNFKDTINRTIILSSINKISSKTNSQIQFDELKLHSSKENTMSIQPNNTVTKPNHSVETVIQSEKIKLQLNSKLFACSICHKDCPVSSGILLANCGHVFCYDCLNNNITLTPGDIHICPFINKKYKCNSIIQAYEVKCLNSNETKALINKNHNANDQSLAKTNIWNCNQCTSENNLTASECEICKQPRASQPVEYIQCMNCFDICHQAKIFMFPKCNHNVCSNCLMVYLEYQLKDEVDNVVCPIKFCEYFLEPQDILAMFIQLDRFYIKNKLNSFDVCVACQVTHSNLTCVQFQHNLKFDKDTVSMRLRAKYEELVNNRDATICPKCKSVIIKQGNEKEYCFTCDAVFKTETLSKPWQCGICCNLNERASSTCGVCGKITKYKTRTRITNLKCMICTLEIPFTKGIALNCSHFFCKTCLESLVLSNQGVLKCPYNQNNKKCSMEIEEYEVLQIMNDPKYNRNQIRLIREVSQTEKPIVLCLKAKCSGWDFIANLKDSKLFICTECSQPNCLVCKIIHAGMTCAIYNDRIKHSSVRTTTFYDVVKRDDDQLISNTKSFKCPICYCVGEAVVLKNCSHTCCKNCLINRIKQTKAETKCIFQNNDYKCDSTLLGSEIKTIIDKKTYEQLFTNE